MSSHTGVAFDASLLGNITVSARKNRLSVSMPSAGAPAFDPKLSPSPNDRSGSSFKRTAAQRWDLVRAAVVHEHSLSDSNFSKRILAAAKTLVEARSRFHSNLKRFSTAGADIAAEAKAAAAAKAAAEATITIADSGSAEVKAADLEICGSGVPFETQVQTDGAMGRLKVFAAKRKSVVADATAAAADNGAAGAKAAASGKSAAETKTAAEVDDAFQKFESNFIHAAPASAAAAAVPAVSDATADRLAALRAKLSGSSAANAPVAAVGASSDPSPAQVPAPAPNPASAATAAVPAVSDATADRLAALRAKLSGSSAAASPVAAVDASSDRAPVRSAVLFAPSETEANSSTASADKSPSAAADRLAALRSKLSR